MNNETIKISATTYVRNGLKMMYPFIQSIQSALPLIDEYIVVLGDSNDGSREAILNIGSTKIKIVDTIWDMNMREGGKLFALQSNIGLDHAKGDWVLHLQADEVIHENDLAKLKKYIYQCNDQPKVEGLLFPFLNFRGDYKHIHTGRQAHRFEIRAFKRNLLIRSYKDSQGFRKFNSLQACVEGEKGEKLHVTKIDVPIFHYNCVRPPKQMKEKAKVFSSMYYNDEWIERHFNDLTEIDYNQVDKLEVFEGSHPKVMEEIIKNSDCEFVYDPFKSNSSLRHKILNRIEDITGYRIGEYKNYKII